MRGMFRDIILFPCVLLLMSVFCCLIFSKRHKVESRGLLGVGAVVSVLLAIGTAYGLLFIVGVPVTAITQVLPFIAFGIGLDDAFIIIGGYSRTDPNKDIATRIEETMLGVGGSILITSLTSSAAFGIGIMSSVSGVRWLCMYAFPTILIDFFYQVTVFVAMITLDERRIQQNRRGKVHHK
mmetsp:Transcript_11132/g.17036  ORF Transcript_11132/g.17036 Transcript_11132/m.17036 type:complete len:181 (-) Transcript_11132:809-1351(-)